MSWDFDAARRYVYTAGRLLDQRLLEVLHEDADPSGVLAALMAYRNPDGGFGHGLEPDKRAPGSQPLDVEIALEYLVASGADGTDVALDACGWLDSLAAPSGAVPVLLPTIVGYPRAGHWAADEYPPGLNPTAAIAGHALELGIEHPWVDRATEFCLREAESGRLPDEAHELLGLAKLLVAAPDQGRAASILSAVAAALPSAAFMNLDAAEEGYGLTPLDFAPTPSSVASAWFDDAQLAAHLERLEHEQQPDGGWPLAWQPPGPASECEWRAIRTVRAMSTLRSHGR